MYMELVKLTNAHKLGKAGYTYAWRSSPWEFKETLPFEKWLTKKFGSTYTKRGAKQWTSGFGADRYIKDDNSFTGRSSVSVYWIAVRDPHMATLIQLQLTEILNAKTNP
jgi:hypothetical protein